MTSNLTFDPATVEDLPEVDQSVVSCADSDLENYGLTRWRGGICIESILLLNLRSQLLESVTPRIEFG